MLLTLDLCALMEFWRADASMLKLMARRLGPVHVPTPTLVECCGIDEAGADSLGLRAVEPSFAQASSAAAVRGAMSFHDRLGLVMASESGWTCIANDGQVRAGCGARRIPVLSSFETLELLVAQGGLSAKRAEATAIALKTVNRRHLEYASVSMQTRRTRRR